MTKKRLLVVTQEMDPYTENTFMSDLITRLPQYAQDKGAFELRVLMPKYGSINERRHRLHEVVRLSGMNIIIDDDDYPLVIKVASMPNSRMQVYFLENEDYFKRKNSQTSVSEDEEGNVYEDNHERMIFFSKAVLETVKKFGWAPDVIHCHGWLTSMIPLYVKEAYMNEPIFKHSTVVYSLYNNTPLNQVPENFVAKGTINALDAALLEPYFDGTNFTVDKGACYYADAIIKGEEEINETVLNQIADIEKPSLEFQDSENYLVKYIDFYKNLLSASEASE